MMLYHAEVVADSLNTVTNDRISTLRVIMPRIILPELVTHRIFFVDDTADAALMREAYDMGVPHELSKNTASSRAIPIRRMLDKAKENPFIPIFRQGQKGMTSGAPVDADTQRASEADWAMMMEACLLGVQRLADRGIEKGQANRPLEWFSWVEVLITSTEWKNFFTLRVHPDAQGEMQETARTVKAAFDESIPVPILPGGWHLPYVDPLNFFTRGEMDNARQSASRCAIISYRSLSTGKMSTMEEDMERYGRLVGGNPKHLSPTEHPSRAQATHDRFGNFVGWKSLRKIEFEAEESGGDFRT